MVIYSIIQFLLSNAVTLRRDKSILYSRVSITMLLYSSLLAFTSLYFTGLRGGICMEDYFIQNYTTLQIFIFLVSALVLQFILPPNLPPIGKPPIYVPGPEVVGPEVWGPGLDTGILWWVVPYIIERLYQEIKPVVTIDVQFVRIGPVRNQFGALIRYSYGIWDLHETSCLKLMLLLEPNSYTVIEGMVWNPITNIFEDRKILMLNFNINFPFIHFPNIVPGPGVPPSTPVWLSIPGSVVNYPRYYFFGYFFELKVLNNGTPIRNTYNIINNTFILSGVIEQIL